jgi:hypothetical protein
MENGPDTLLGSMTRIGSVGGWWYQKEAYAVRRLRASSASAPTDNAASDAGSGAGAIVPL